MGLGFAVAWVVLASILDLSVGLVFLSAIAAWLTGTAVALGAEPGSFRRQRSTILLAIAVCLGIWVVGTCAAYVVSLAILPDSTLDLLARMANAPFLDSIARQLHPRRARRARRPGALRLAGRALTPARGADQPVVSPTNGMPSSVALRLMRRAAVFCSATSRT